MFGIDGFLYNESYLLRIYHQTSDNVISNVPGEEMTTISLPGLPKLCFPSRPQKALEGIYDKILVSSLQSSRDALT